VFSLRWCPPTLHTPTQNGRAIELSAASATVVDRLFASTKLRIPIRPQSPGSDRVDFRRQQIVFHCEGRKQASRGFRFNCDIGNHLAFSA
jgi:hypothetical protein